MKKYCRLCKKKEHREECGYGPKMWDKYSVDDASEKEQESAAKESGIIDEANKSGDSSLRDWFSKSRASDGTPGWVQLGGKYAGKPCAKQPGQTTKPKCGSSKMKRNLDKGEEEAAFRRKNRKDPNPDRKGKAINVATEETTLDEKCWQGYSQKGMKKKGNKVVPNCVPVGEEKQDHEYSMARSELKTLKNAAKRLEKKMGKKGEGNLEAWVQSKITKAADYIDTAADYVTNEAAGEKDACYQKVKSRYKVWPSAYASGALVKCRKVGAKNWGSKSKNESVTIENASGKTFAEFIDIVKPEPLQPTQGLGSDLIGEAGDYWHPDPKKDAQISGAGNKARAREDRAGASKPIVKKEDPKKLRKGESYYDWAKRQKSSKSSAPKPKERKRDKIGRALGKALDRVAGIKTEEFEISEAVRIPAKTGNIIITLVNWRGKLYELRLFFPQVKLPTRQEVQDQIVKVYPGARLQNFRVSTYDPGQQIIRVSEQTDEDGEGVTENYELNTTTSGEDVVDSEGPQIEEDWQKVNRQDKTDGLSSAAVKAYRRENPGSKLKTAVTKKPSELKAGSKDAKRRKSFCSRMSGMKKRLTSAKTARDPDSRINKALRRWNCN